MTRRRVPWLRLALLAALAAAWWRKPDVGALVPEAWKPWTPLDVRAAPDRFTRTKLARLADDPLACLAALSDAGGAYRLLPERDLGPGCAQRNALQVRRSGVRAEPFVLSCRAAVSLALWERHVLQPAARRHFGTRAARLEHYGSYACRNVYGRATARRSQHATADALDVAAIVLADGRRLRVLDDWNAEGARAAFWRDLHAGACRHFDTVLGPDYNRAHRDHLHLDRGPYRLCR